MAYSLDRTILVRLDGFWPSLKHLDWQHVDGMDSFLRLFAAGRNAKGGVGEYRDRLDGGELPVHRCQVDINAAGKPAFGGAA
ncbi:MAG: hypothetical protein ACOC6A_02595 [Chloroflexota bacterium]|jgi:hypothetical protein